MALWIAPSLEGLAGVFPSAQWDEATPKSQGVDSAKLKAAAELLAKTVGNDGARELVVIRHGRMIWRGDDIDKRHGVWSATKSFTSTVLGLLIADGKCTLDTRVAEVLPEKRHPSNPGPDAAYVEDWRPGDPDWGAQQGRAIIGALNDLAAQHVNSL